MARRRTSLIEDIFDMLQQMPWWAGVIAAGVFWGVGQGFAARQSTDPMQAALRPIFGMMFNVLALVSLIAAVASTVRAAFRRKLLDQQRDLESLKLLSWREFEQLVGEAYRRQGYSVVETGGGGADGGVDVRLSRGGETVLVQCKRWRTQRVGVDKVAFRDR